MNGTTDPLFAATHLTNDLMAGPGHKANILNANFTHVGIGSWRTAPGQTWSGGGYPLINVFLTAQVCGRLTTSTPPPALPGALTSVVAAGGVAPSTCPGRRPPRTGGRQLRRLRLGRRRLHREASRRLRACWNATVPGIPNGKQYFVTVHGHNAAGWGGQGSSGWVTFAAVPGPPTEVRAVPNNASVSGPGRSRPTRARRSTATPCHLRRRRLHREVPLRVRHLHGDRGRPGQRPLVPRRRLRPQPHRLGHPDALRLGGRRHAGRRRRGSPRAGGDGSANVSWTPATSSGLAIDLYAMFVFDSFGYTGQYADVCGTCTSGTVNGLINGRTYWMPFTPTTPWASAGPPSPPRSCPLRPEQA